MVLQKQSPNVGENKRFSSYTSKVGAFSVSASFVA